MEASSSYKDTDDADLIKETLAGHPRAYDELIHRHSRKLHAMLYQMLSNESDAFDVAQQSFLKAYHALRHFAGKSSFYTWLYTIAANNARNFLRKRKRENTFSLNQDEEHSASDKDIRLADNSIAADPVRQAEIKDLKLKLAAAIETLSPAHREVVILCDIQGMSYSEISKILKISEGTLRSRLHYAHKQLQGLLANEKF